MKSSKVKQSMINLDIKWKMHWYIYIYLNNSNWLLIFHSMRLNFLFLKKRNYYSILTSWNKAICCFIINFCNIFSRFFLFWFIRIYWIIFCMIPSVIWWRIMSWMWSWWRFSNNFCNYNSLSFCWWWSTRYYFMFIFFFNRVFFTLKKNV